MNIWYISKYAVSPDQGQPTRQFFMSKYLAKLGHKVTLFSSVSSGIKIKPNIKASYYQNMVDGVKTIVLDGPLIDYGMSVKRILSWGIFEFNLFRKIRLFKENPPDVIIVSSLSLLTFLNGVYLKRKYGAKLILEVRDIWPLTLIEVGGFSKNNPIIKLLSMVEKYGYERADGIVGTMPRLDKHVSNVISKSFNFRCIPMGYDPDYLSIKNVNDELEILPKGRFIVGYAGTIGTANLVEEILEAARILAPTHPNIFFAILGEGILKESLREKNSDLKNVKFYSRIDKKYVPLFLEKCDLLVNCWKNENLYRYGVSPNKWIDYMLSSRPVLVAFGGHQSIINEADCGYFIPPNDPVLLADKISEISSLTPEELTQMGARGKKYVIENHNYVKLADDYIKFIKELL